MNFPGTKLPETIREGFLAMDAGDIKIFFRSLKDQEFERIGELTSEDLTDIQSRVRLLKELEHYVSTLPQEIKKTKK